MKILSLEKVSLTYFSNNGETKALDDRVLPKGTYTRFPGAIISSSSGGTLYVKYWFKGTGSTISAYLLIFSSKSTKKEPIRYTGQAQFYIGAIYQNVYVTEN